MTYGYGSMEELVEAHADYIVETVAELQDFSCGNCANCGPGVL